jgi:hypothetical protein
MDMPDRALHRTSGSCTPLARKFGRWAQEIWKHELTNAIVPVTQYAINLPVSHLLGMLAIALIATHPQVQHSPFR